MRHRETSLGSWRLEVCDDYLKPCFEILFAEVNDDIDHLPREYRETVESASRSTALLHDAIGRVYTSIEQVRATLASVDATVAAVSVHPARRHPE
jgi:hypothetical protein